MRTRRDAVLVTLALSLVSPAALAADWTVKLPGGAQLAITEDPASSASPFRLERRHAATGLDRQFGQGGSVLLQLGRETGSPSGLRVDAQGNILVFGQVVPGNSIRMPVLLRFDSRGMADRRWAAGGRAQITSFGADLAPEDVLPLSDGKLLLLGGSEGKPDRAVLWRLTANGQLDTGFGVGGWLALRREQGAQGVSLATSGSAGSAVMIGVQVALDSGAQLEVHRWEPEQATDPLLVARQAMPENWVGAPVLEQRQDRWGWLASADSGGAQRAWLPLQMLPAAQFAAWRIGPAPNAAVAEPAAAPRSATEGSVAFNPYANRTAAAKPAATVPVGDSDSWAWIGWAAGAVVGAVIGATAALWLALRRRDG